MSWVLGLRGPGRLAGGGFEETVDASARSDELAGEGSRDMISETGTAVATKEEATGVAVFPIPFEPSSDDSESKRGHFFASSESSETSITSLWKSC